MATGVVSWSQTAATNATADENVNWAEGMAPSAVNNSARAEMASVAMYRDDNAGSLTTGGTSTAYTVSTNQGFASLTAMNGQSIRVKFNAANGASPTLNVDGLGAKAINIDTSTAVPTGMIRANSVLSLVYDNSNSCFLIVGLPSEFVSGDTLVSQNSTAPTGWTISTTHNDKALRLVSSSPSTGGSTAFTSIFTSRTIAKANLPNYTLTTTVTGGSATLKTDVLIQSGSTGIATGGDPGQVPSSSTYGNSQGTLQTTFVAPTVTVASGGSGTALDFAVQYVDVVIITKD